MNQTVTRIEIADTVRSAFDRHGTDRTHLLAIATVNQARPQVLAALAALPDRRYSALRDLWEHLAHIPIEA